KAEISSWHWRHRHGPFWVDGAAVDVIQAPKLEPRIARYELSDYEWTAISRCRRTSRAAFGAAYLRWPDSPGPTCVGSRACKVHCLSDARGIPLVFHLTPGEAADSSQRDN